MSPIPQANGQVHPPLPNTPPFNWNQLSPNQQSQLTHLLARLLKQWLMSNPNRMKEEVSHDPPPQNQ